MTNRLHLGLKVDRTICLRFSQRHFLVALLIRLPFTVCRATMKDLRMKTLSYSGMHCCPRGALLTLTSDGNSNNDKTVRLFSLTRTKLLQTINHPTCMNYSVISPDSRILAAVGDENFAYFYRIVRDSGRVDYGDHGQRLSGWTCKFICRIELPLSTTMRSSDDGSCFTIAFSPASHLCAIGSQAGLISVFDVESILQNKEDAQCKLQVFRSSRPDSDAGAVRSMAFSPEPWDLLVWVEDMGKFGIADVRSGFLRRQVVDLDKDGLDVERVRTTFRSPFISRSAGDHLDNRPDEETSGVHQAMLDFLGGPSSTTSNPGSSERVSSLRESVQGLTDRERRIIEFLNTARWSSRQDGDEGERPPRTPSNLRHSANASSLGSADVADPSPRTTSPFRSTDTALHELFREHYLGRVGSTERNFGQRRRDSIVVSQPGSGSDSNMENTEDSNSTADVQVLLRWTTSPVEVQPSESPSRPDENNPAGTDPRPIEIGMCTSSSRATVSRLTQFSYFLLSQTRRQLETANLLSVRDPYLVDLYAQGPARKADMIPSAQQQQQRCEPA